MADLTNKSRKESATMYLLSTNEVGLCFRIAISYI